SLAAGLGIVLVDSRHGDGVVADVGGGVDRRCAVDDGRGDAVLGRRGREVGRVDVLAGRGCDGELDVVAGLQALDRQDDSALGIDELRRRDPLGRDRQGELVALVAILPIVFTLVVVALVVVTVVGRVVRGVLGGLF